MVHPLNKRRIYLGGIATTKVNHTNVTFSVYMSAGNTLKCSIRVFDVKDMVNTIGTLVYMVRDFLD